jgi:hypothetical protein
VSMTCVPGPETTSVFGLGMLLQGDIMFPLAVSLLPKKGHSLRMQSDMCLSSEKVAPGLGRT